MEVQNSEESPPLVTNDEAYKVLDKTDLAENDVQMSQGARKTWVGSFLGEHLPSNRLKANEDDLSLKYESVDCTRRRKKKRGKSKACVSKLAKGKPRLDWKLEADANLSYSSFMPLHEMWLKYMDNLFHLSSNSNLHLPTAAQKMMKADLHGCPLTVRKSKCPSYVGVSGIVMQETRNMFVLITPQDRVKRIPKANSIFNVVLHDYVFTIHGNHFRVQPGERASKKLKSKSSIDL